MNNITSIEYIELKNQLDRIERKLDDALWDDDEDDTSPSQEERDAITEEEIKRHGERIPYNLIDDAASLTKFREFIYYIKKNQRDFNSLEYQYAGYSDKTFKDVRLSDNAYRILSNAYMKTYHRDWGIKITKGYMYKYQGRILWEWF